MSVGDSTALPAQDERVFDCSEFRARDCDIFMWKVYKELSVYEGRAELQYQENMHMKGWLKHWWLASDNHFLNMNGNVDVMSEEKAVPLPKLYT